MDTLIFELLSTATLTTIRAELGGHMMDQLRDIDRGILQQVDVPVFEAFLVLQKVLDEKEGR